MEILYPLGDKAGLSCNVILKDNRCWWEIVSNIHFN